MAFTFPAAAAQHSAATLSTMLYLFPVSDISPHFPVTYAETTEKHSGELYLSITNNH